LFFGDVGLKVLCHIKRIRYAEILKNRMLNKMFGFERGRSNRKLGKLHNKEFCDLYSSPDIVRVIK